MLFNAHYAQNYAGIIGTSLLGYSCLYRFFGKLHNMLDPNKEITMQCLRLKKNGKASMQTVTEQGIQQPEHIHPVNM